MTQRRKYAWKPDTPDHRDQIFASKLKSISSIPISVDPIGANNPIENQGSLGSCTGNASTSMLEIKTAHPLPLSRLMAYYNGRVIDGTTKTDEGAEIRSVIKGLVKSGTSNEQTWPYVISRFNIKPNSQSVKEGAALVKTNSKFKYCRVVGLKAVLENLAAGNTVTFGFSVTDAFDSLGKNQILQLPGKDEKTLGGHAVLAVGYNRSARYVWVRNSWGKEWGKDGHFKMSFDWFDDSRRLVDDMWTLVEK